MEISVHFANVEDKNKGNQEDKNQGNQENENQGNQENENKGKQENENKGKEEDKNQGKQENENKGKEEGEKKVEEIDTHIKFDDEVAGTILNLPFPYRDKPTVEVRFALVLGYYNHNSTKYIILAQLSKHKSPDDKSKLKKKIKFRSPILLK